MPTSKLPIQAPSNYEQIDPDLVRALTSGQYDFLDIGSSSGKSFPLAVDTLGLKRGIGIDIDEKKVLKAREKGYDVFVQDATLLKLLPNCVDAVIMSHFLEHLPTLQLANSCISGALTAARDYVFIRQPFFDANGPLMRLGFKMYYADWKGHRNLMTSYDVWRAFRPALDKGKIDLAIYGRWPVARDAQRSVVELSAPVDLRKHQVEQWGCPNNVYFDFPVYRELVAVATKLNLDGTPRADIHSLIKALGDVHLIRSFSGANQPHNAG